MIQLTIEVIKECWIWQIFTILRYREKLEGWSGYYDFDIDMQKARIRYIKIKPFIWKWILEHEQGHHIVTLSSKTFVESSKRNAEYDSVTWHGLMQWRAKNLPYWPKS